MTSTIMAAAANSLRGMFIAGPGKKLVVSDLSNIEGRVLPWLASEEWKLQAFRDYDAGRGPDLYVLSFSKAFRIAVELVTKYQRQQGKGMELSMGYEGGVGAFINIALTYGLDLIELAKAVLAVAPADVRSEAKSFWGWAVKENRTLGLDEDVFVACDILKRLWRRAHPKTANKCKQTPRCEGPCSHSGLWENYQKAMRNAIQAPNTIIETGRCAFVMSDNWLRVLLPSGDELSYPSAKVNEHGEISYMGMNQYNRKWSRLKTYGGKIAENVDQKVARNVLAGAMPRAEAAGYQIVLTVHDELITEAPNTPDYDDKKLSAILATNEEWNRGLPLAAGGFQGPRYKKES